MSEQLEFSWNDLEAPAARPAEAAATGVQFGQWKTELLARELERRTGFPIDLRITDNTSTLMSLKLRNDNRGARLRLHHMFLDAPPAVRTALCDWIRRPRPRKAAGIIDRFIQDRRHLVRQSPGRPIETNTEGEHHDLGALFDEVNVAHFEGRIECGITWGRMPTVSRRRSIRFGSYAPDDNLIRIHPLLDQAFVPRYFVRYIVYHEMLHADLGIEERPGRRRIIHSKEFNERERAYPDYDRAIGWMKNTKNLRRLLYGRRTASG